MRTISGDGHPGARTLFTYRSDGLSPFNRLAVACKGLA
jgi:hypothetical protein